VKLKNNELKEAHAKGANVTNERKRQKRDEAKELRKSGILFKDIAKKLEISLRTVKCWKLSKC